VWILPENARRLAIYEQQLRQPAASGTPIAGQLPSHAKTEGKMTNAIQQGDEVWTTASLYEALAGSSLCTSGRADLELIDGVAPALHIVMADYGDLPIFLTVSGEQVLVEAYLWSMDEVRDVAQFNEAILRTHKFFPLSTISLDRIDGDDCYHMFGALSSQSSLQNIVFEIEMLASNVIQATQAYAEFLLDE
jgi:uncharacterized protein YjfI (DUF2170 family)